MCPTRACVSVGACMCALLTGAGGGWPVCAGAVHAGCSTEAGGCGQQRVQLPGQHGSVSVCTEGAGQTYQFCCRQHTVNVMWTPVSAPAAAEVRGCCFHVWHHCVHDFRCFWTSSCLCGRCSWVTCGAIRRLPGGPSRTWWIRASLPSWLQGEGVRESERESE